MLNTHALGRNRNPNGSFLPKLAENHKQEVEKIADAIDIRATLKLRAKELRTAADNLEQAADSGSDTDIRLAIINVEQIAAGCNQLENRLAGRTGHVRHSRRTDWSMAEKEALINEDGVASNAHKLKLEGTHYAMDDEPKNNLWELFI